VVTIPYTFSSGINTSFSTELNSNFGLTATEIEKAQSTCTVAYSNTPMSESSTTYATYLTLESPATAFDNQYVLIEMEADAYQTDPSGTVRFYDVTNSTSLDTADLFTDQRRSLFYLGKMQITNADTTVSVALQVKGDGSDSSSISAGKIKLTLLSD